MLAEEPVGQPPDHYRGGEVALWSMWWSLVVLEALGKRWRHVWTQSLALRLHESELAVDCVAWLHLAADESRLYTYLSFHPPANIREFVEDLAELKGARGTELNGALPAAAEPVLKRRADGTLVWLWPPPGPDVPKRQKMTVEWATFTVLHRAYALQQRA